MLTDGIDILKRSWAHVRQNPFLWIFAFFIALAGGSSQSFSLWVESPIPRGLTGYSPVHQIGQRVTESARGNAWFWILFVGAGVIVGVMVAAVAAFAQAAAIGGVSDLEEGRSADFGTAFRRARSSFARFFVLMLGYFVLIALLAVPSFVFWWTVGDRGLVVPCLGGLVLGVVLVAASALASIIVEIAGRFVVIEDMGITDAVGAAWGLIRDYSRDVIITWFYVLVITLAGLIAMVLFIAVTGSPLARLFAAIADHHGAFLVALGILVLMATWAVAAALSGIFALAGSAVWTVMFVDLEGTPSAKK